MQDSPIDTSLAPVLQRPKSSGLAITSMVFGILSVTSLVLFFLELLPEIGFCLALLAGLLAIILGCIAYNRSRKAPEQYRGRGFAKAGIVMGCVSIFLTMLAVAPNLVPARTTAVQKACVNNLRRIDAAMEQWALENKKTKGEAVVEDQVNAYLKNSQRPECPAGGTYTYGAVGVNPTCSLGAALGHTL